MTGVGAPRPTAVVAGILAGGGGSRMGGGVKCLRLLAGRTMLDHVLGCVGAQVEAVVIAGGRNLDALAATGLAVVPDAEDAIGPLSGLCAALEWAAALDSRPDWVLSVTADTPFLPVDLVARLAAAANAAGRPAACARTDDGIHPFIALWRPDLLAPLREAIAQEGMRSGRDWLRRIDGATAHFQPSGGISPFFNVNRPEDLAAAERMLLTVPLT